MHRTNFWVQKHNSTVNSTCLCVFVCLFVLRQGPDCPGTHHVGRPDWPQTHSKPVSASLNAEVKGMHHLPESVFGYFFFFLVFRDRVSLCSPGCPGAHFVDQAGLELRNPPASASRVLGLKGVRHHARLESFLNPTKKEGVTINRLMWAGYGGVCL
jgi:hypothetical protein